ncbi:substrate-binding periplasmic protein [Pseudodesulfovibrio cashew]|nr:transporter substrate-binding domain-containing protein [Pseudodesulfovibrio cashew]
MPGRGSLFYWAACMVILLWTILASPGLAASAAAPANPQAEPTMVFTSFPCQGMGVLFERILREAYGELGYSVVIRRVPAERALVMANAGLVDGEAARVPVIELRNPDLIKVPTPLYVNRVAAFTRGKDIDLEAGWDSLRQYRIGCLLGYKYINKQTQGMERVMVPSYEQLFALLRKGRVDIVVAEYLDAMSNILKEDDFQVLQPFLAENPMYHYLNKKNAALVPKVDAVLRRMLADGRMDAILRDVEVSLGCPDLDCPVNH